MKAKVRNVIKSILRNDYSKIAIGVILAIIANAIFNLVSSCALERDVTSIRNLIRSEADLVKQTPRTALAEQQYEALFFEDAWIADASTQSFWKGRREILERFRSMEEFKTLEHRLDKDPAFTSDHSAVASTTTQSAFVESRTAMVRSYIGHEIWIFEKVDGRWKIKNFQVNLP